MVCTDVLLRLHLFARPLRGVPPPALSILRSSQLDAGALDTELFALLQARPVGKPEARGLWLCIYLVGAAAKAKESGY